MQWPPTSPGLSLMKFHFEEAASRTSWVSMPIALKILASSFMKAILTSRCAFSMILDASATRMDGALCVPLTKTDRYTRSTNSAISGVDPDVTFLIFSTVCSLSPGLMRSGLYPAKKSRLKRRPDTFSMTGRHSSSVTPG